MVDAADFGIMIVVYASFELPDKSWSSAHILAKSILAPDDMTIPKKELAAFNAGANIKVVLERALDGWIEAIYVGGDSEISIVWISYESVKLSLFHRNRVVNIRSKVNLNQIVHIKGSENCADIGTRPNDVTADTVMPGSDWLQGKPWLKLSYDEMIKQGVIKTVSDIKLSNDAKKVMKEGMVFDQFDEKDYNLGILNINTIDIQTVAKFEAYSNYIYPPLKRSYRSTVKIVSLVLLAVRKFKKKLIG